MPMASYEDVANKKAECGDMTVKSRDMCKKMELAIIKQDCKPLKSKPAQKACFDFVGGMSKAEVKKEIVKTKKTKVSPSKPKKKRPVKHEKTECTYDWVENKCNNNDPLDILRVCGTKRHREYAKCFDKDTPTEREKCIDANKERVEGKRGTNSDGFKCYNHFRQSCFVKIGDKDVGNKIDYCNAKWWEKKPQFVGRDKENKSILKVKIGKCKI